MRNLAMTCHDLQKSSAEDRIRMDSSNPLLANDLSDSARVSAAAGAAIADNSAPIDPRLAVVVEAWPKLPESVRAAVLRLVKATGGEG
jgi:hypothetical protein